MTYLMEQGRTNSVVVLAILLVSLGAEALLANSIGVPGVKLLERDLVLHYGDLVLTGNTSMNITNDEYFQNGDVILRDNATLNLDHATLGLNLSYPLQYRIQLNNASRLISSSSIIQGNSTFYLRILDSANLNLNSTTTINLALQVSDSSQTQLNNVTTSEPVLARDSSIITAVDLKVLGSVTLLNNAQANISRATIRSIIAQNASSLTLIDSSTPALWLADGIKTTLLRDRIEANRLSLQGADTVLTLAPGTINRQVVVPANGFNATFIQSQVGSWTLDFSSSQVSLQQSKINVLISTSSSLTLAASLVNTTFINGGSMHFQGTNSILEIFSAYKTQIVIDPQTLYVARILVATNTAWTFNGGKVVREITVRAINAQGNPLSDSHLTVSSNGSNVVDILTDVHGEATFNLTFQSTQQSYLVRASKSGLTGNSQIDVTTQNFIDLQLGTSLGSLPFSFLLTALLILVIYRGFARRLSRQASRTRLMALKRT